jgi:hypothetical protein
MDERRSNKPKVDGSAPSLTPLIRKLPLDPLRTQSHQGDRVTVLHQGEWKLLLRAHIDRSDSSSPYVRPVCDLDTPTPSLFPELGISD